MAIGLFALSLLQAEAPAASTPQVSLHLSKTTIFAGEPVWGLVSATNSSDRKMVWNPGDYCSTVQKPVKAVLDDTGTPDNVIPCAHGEFPANAAGLSCMMGQNVVHLHPHQSITQRFLLEGRFPLTTVGEHAVHLTLRPKYTFSQDINAIFLPGTSMATVEAKLPLRILPPNNAALLAIEQQLAKEASEPLPTGPGDRDGQMMARNDWGQTQQGLGHYPAEGMEATFREWIAKPRFSSTARNGLRRLNTPAAHAILLQAAQDQQGQEQFANLAALIATRHANDLPVLLDLLNSPNPAVRREAILGLGKVGGDAAIPALLHLIHAEATQDRNDALSALSDIRTHQAVHVLIDLLKGPEPISEARGPLYSLTHHQDGFNPKVQTPEQLAAAWEKWWNGGGKDAPLYDSLSSCLDDAA